jgi:putative hemolysin
VGDVPRILLRHGCEGLYTNTQFRFDQDFFRQMGPALELGRSFVRPEYQRQFMPLALLWRGICAWIARRPEYATLIGAVSVSGQYSRSSRELIAAYFDRLRTAGDAASVEPRRPLRGRMAKGAMPSGVEELSEWISEIETDRKGLPILVKQYVKLGGRILAFSQDPTFGNTLDGFVLLDLRTAPVESLERYMGKDAANAFLGWHGAASRPAA